MRKIKNTNSEDFSVETAENGFHAIRSGKTEMVDVDESKVEYYRSKGFEVSDLIEDAEPAKEPAKDGQEPAKQAQAQDGKDSQPPAKSDGKETKPDDKTSASGVQIVK